MPKKIQPISAEVVLHGQPSAALLADIKRAGERVTTAHLIEAIGHLEAARVGFVTEAVATGLLLLTKKQTLKHGQWRSFLAEVWTGVTANAKRVSRLEGPVLHNFVRSLQGYTFLAQHFLADLEQGEFQPEATDQRVAPPAVTPVEVLALDTLPQEKRVAVYGAIERFVAGRSLRRMLMDFRRAENAADQEEIEEESRRRRKRKDDAPEGQMDFYADMMKPLGEIDTLFDTQSFVERTDKKFWISVAEKLETQARRARELAKEIRS